MHDCTGSWVYLEIISQLGLKYSRLSTTNIRTTVGKRILKNKFLG